MNAPGGDLDRLLRRLAGRRALARIAILFERIWPALWPPLGVAGVFICIALLDLPRLLPPWAHIGLLAVTALLIVGLLMRGLHGIAAPDDKAADRRLELASGLAHRPLAVLTDRPSRGRRGPDTAGSRCGRRMSRARCAQVRRLRVGLPRPGLARRDPRALRAALVVALVAAFGIAGDDAPSRLAQAMEPTLPRDGAAAGHRTAGLDHAARLYAAGADLPQGRTAARFRCRPALASDRQRHRRRAARRRCRSTAHSEPFRALDKASFQADRDLTAGGHLAVRRGGRELAAWDLTVVADQPPTAEWSEPPGPRRRQPADAAAVAASDDYGVVSLQAEMRLRDRPDAPPLVVEPAAARRDAEIGAWRQPAGPDGASLGRAAGDRASWSARDAPGQTGRQRRGQVRAAGAAVPEPDRARADGDPPGLSLHPDDRGCGGGRAGCADDAARGVRRRLSAPT